MDPFVFPRRSHPRLYRVSVCVGSSEVGRWVSGSCVCFFFAFLRVDRGLRMALVVTLSISTPPPPLSLHPFPFYSLLSIPVQASGIWLNQKPTDSSVHILSSHGCWNSTNTQYTLKREPWRAKDQLNPFQPKPGDGRKDGTLRNRQLQRVSGRGDEIVNFPGWAGTNYIK